MASDIIPSEVPTPVSMSLFPLPVEGSEIDCTNVPLGVYSSTNTTFPVLTRAADPSPRRYTTKSPGVKAAGTSRASKFSMASLIFGLLDDGRALTERKRRSISVPVVKIEKKTSAKTSGERVRSRGSVISREHKVYWYPSPDEMCDGCRRKSAQFIISSLKSILSCYGNIPRYEQNFRLTKVLATPLDRLCRLRHFSLSRLV